MSSPPPISTRGNTKSDVAATFRKVINLRRPVQILRRLKSRSNQNTSRNVLPPLYTTALEYSTGSSFMARGSFGSNSGPQNFGYGSTRSTMALKFPQRSPSLLGSSVEEEPDQTDGESVPTTPRTPEKCSESELYSSSEHVDRVLRRMASIEEDLPDENTPLQSNQYKKGIYTKDYLKVKRKIPFRRHRQSQDSYDPEEDEVGSTENFDNFYDAMQGGEQSGQATSATNPPPVIPEVRVNVDPTDRLIDVMESLREVIVENTNQSKGGGGGGGAGAGRKRGRQTQGSGQPYRANGTPMGLKDDRLKIRREKVIVELRVVFLKIGEIDTLKEQYSADTFIQAKWREPALDGKTLEELKRVDFDKFWNPLLYIDNILGETKEATWLTATVNSRGEAYVLERRRVRGIFMENLELNDFPLDVQDLTVTITSERPDTEIDIIPDENEMSGINVQTFVDQQEWRLHEHIEVSKKVMTQEYSSSNRCHPALSVTCRAARRPGYFYWNVFLVMFFISALSFATFAVSPELPQNRLQLSFTLLLTSVAFKFVINQSLPKISYLTYMDKYVLLSLVILCVVCIWHAVVTVFMQHGPQFMAELERDVFIAFAVIYVICHLVFMFWLYFDACKRRRLMKQKDREYLEFLAKKKEWHEKTKDLHPNSRRQSTLLMHSVHALP